MTEPLPSSIVLYDGEADYQHPELDLLYIDGVAADVAATLHDRECAEVCYQPGDGTRYGLVFVPLRSLVPARARVKNGQEWDRHSCGGMIDTTEARIHGLADINRLPYLANGYLVARVEGNAYPVRLGGRGPRPDIVMPYVAEHWGAHGVSAVSVAILLRAVSVHLDRLAAQAAA